jgi:AraC-like DNA-binding protein
LSVDGKPLPLLRQAQGEIAAYDYRRSWEGDLASAFDCVNFHLPRTLMSELGSDPGTCVIDDLNLNAGQTVDDAVVYGLARSLLPALSRPREVNALFTSHVATALSAHIVSTYADFARPRDRKAGTLAPWQERRAKDMISADITGSLGLADIAAECGLSASHFGRAFRKTTGFPPHRWLLFHRIEISKSLLLDTRRTIAEIADTCGFADQSHFSRVFARFTGATPAAWRRRCAT